MSRTSLVCAAALLAVALGCQSSKKTTEEPAPEKEAAAPASTRVDGDMLWVSRAYPTGERHSSTVLVERGAPREVQANQAYDYVIRVTNLTSHKIEDVVVSEQPANNFKLKSATPSPASSGGRMSWNLGAMAAKSTSEIRVTGSAPSSGDVTCCCDVKWESLLCTTTRVVQPQLALVKTGTAETLICDPITYKFTVTNGGSGDARNVVIEDKLPDGLKTMSGNNVVRIDVGTLAAGASKSFSVQAKADKTGSFTNRATANAAGLNAQSGSHTVKVTRPVLQITKTGTQNTFIGRDIDYDITVRNVGDGEARDTILSDPIPNGAQFKSASGGGSMQGGSVVWNIGTLAPGASKSFKLELKAGGESEVRNTATVRAYCAKDESATVVTKITGIPAILLEVIDIEDPVEVGDQETYVITVTNQGSTADTNIRIVCELEDQETVTTDGVTKARTSGNTVTFEPLGTLGAKDKAVWKVVVKAKEAGDKRFRVRLTSDQLKRPVEESEATNQYK